MGIRHYITLFGSTQIQQTDDETEVYRFKTSETIGRLITLLALRLGEPITGAELLQIGWADDLDGSHEQASTGTGDSDSVQRRRCLISAKSRLRGRFDPDAIKTDPEKPTSHKPLKTVTLSPHFVTVDWLEFESGLNNGSMPADVAAEKLGKGPEDGVLEIMSLAHPDYLARYFTALNKLLTLLQSTSLPEDLRTAVRNAHAASFRYAESLGSFAHEFQTQFSLANQRAKDASISLIMQGPVTGIATARRESDVQVLTNAESTPERERTAITEPIRSANMLRTLDVPRTELLETAERTLSMRGFVHLYGPPGGGKSWIARQLVTKLGQNYPDGTWIIPLEEQPDIEDGTDKGLIWRIRSELGVLEETGKAASERVFTYLVNKQLLLVLDNCDHFVSSAISFIKAVPLKCPGVHIVTTCRESLRWEYESELHIGCLDTPNLAAGSSVAQFEDIESVRLFLLYARLSSSREELSVHNSVAVAQICQLLDGNPLALRLAAGQSRLLSFSAIAERLKKSGTQLTGGGRAHAHQSAMDAAIAWTYQLLDPEDQRLLMVLAQFVGGWDVDSVEAILLRSSVGDIDVIEALDNLLNVSFIEQSKVDAGDIRRFRMLEVIRAYCIRSAPLENGAELRRLHLEYFTDLAERAEEELVRRDRGEWMNRLALDHANFKAALETALSNDEFLEFGLRLAGAIGRFWWLNGNFSEGLDYYLRLINASRTITPSNGLAKVYKWAGALSCDLGRVEGAERILEAGLEVSRQIGSKKLEADILTSMGVNAQYLGQEFLHVSEERYLEALAVYDQLLGSPVTDSELFSHAYQRRANILDDLATLKIEQKLMTEAETYLSQLNLMNREALDPHTLVSAAQSRSKVALYKDDVDSARNHALDALELSKRYNDAYGIVRSIHYLIDVELITGALESARCRLDECLELVDIMSKHRLARTLLVAAQLAQAQGHAHRAEQLFLAEVYLRAEPPGCRRPPSLDADFYNTAAAISQATGRPVLAGSLDEAYLHNGSLAIDRLVALARSVADLN